MATLISSSVLMDHPLSNLRDEDCVDAVEVEVDAVEVEVPAINHG